MGTLSEEKNPIAKLHRLLNKHRPFAAGTKWKIAGSYAKLLLCEPFRIVENWRYPPARIERHEIERPPIFVIGHWRSGTSYLQYLMTKDPNFDFFNRFQVIFPHSFLTSEPVLKPLFNRAVRLIPLARAFDSISIDIDLDEPGELDIAFIFLVSPVNPHWGHAFPRHAYDYFSRYILFETADQDEIEQWKATYRFMIKKLSIKNGNRPILIKSPGNTSRIPQLLDLYPDAKFIYIHRNPYDVFYSNRKLWNVILNNIAVEHITPEERDKLIVWLYKKVIGSYLTHRSLIPKENLAEVRFEEFTSQPLKIMRSIYRILSLDDVEEAIRCAKPFVRRQKKDSASSYRYDPEIIELLTDEWSESLEAWPYPNPLKRVPKAKAR